MPPVLNPDTEATDADIDFDTWQDKYWPLGQRLSNPSLHNGLFTVEEKATDGIITYKLPLDDFLAVQNKSSTPGTGFYASKCTKNIHLDEGDPYVVQFEACSLKEADDWTSEKCNLRQYLKMNNGILFGNDIAAAVLVKKETKGSGWETYEMSSEKAKAFTVDKEKEGQVKEGEHVPDSATYEFHPEHKPAAEPMMDEGQGPRPGEVMAFGLFGTGARVGQLINVIIDGPPHPGVIKWRKDAKGHEYFGCEKHEHPVTGNLKISKAICR